MDTLSLCYLKNYEMRDKIAVNIRLQNFLNYDVVNFSFIFPATSKQTLTLNHLSL